eukprot:2947165-Pleurochrysis_carterae.AAC.1
MGAAPASCGMRGSTAPDVDYLPGIQADTMLALPLGVAVVVFRNDKQKNQVIRAGYYHMTISRDYVSVPVTSIYEPPVAGYPK